MVKTLKEAEERIRAAMIPKSPGGNFAPNIQKLRQTAKEKRLPTGR